MPFTRLFTAGTHKNLTYTNEDIARICARSKEPAQKAPFVLGHPHNNLPIVGWLDRRHLATYKEGDKLSIGFKREHAEFSEESLQALRALKRNKISVRLKDGIIAHIGLVENAAVSDNNSQDFSQDDACLPVQDFSIDPPQADLWQKTKNYIHDLFLNKNKMMTHTTPPTPPIPPAPLPNTQDFSEEKKRYETRLAALEQENAALKKAHADFADQQKDALKQQLADKLKALQLSADQTKATTDFGWQLLEKDTDLFKSWLAQIQPAPPQVVQGSVVASEDFSKQQPAQDALRAQYTGLKTS